MSGKKSFMLFLKFIIGGYVIICLLMFFLQQRFIFFPEKLSPDYSYSFPRNLNWEEVWINNDHEKINGIHFKADSSKGVILYFHGNAGSLKSWGYVAEDFMPLGWDLLIIDYRTFGKSTGKLTYTSLLSDGQAAYDYLLQSYQASEILIYGRSLGTGIAAHIANKNNAPKLLLETPYTSLVDLSHHYYKWLPVKWLHRFPLSVKKHLSSFENPVFIIHGTDDKVIPVHNSHQLSKTFPNQIRLFVEIQGGGHNDLSQYHQFREFLQKALSY